MKYTKPTAADLLVAVAYSGNWSYSKTVPQNQGTNGNWWSSTANSNADNAYNANVNSNGNVNAGTNNNNKRNGNSVRCVLPVAAS